MTKLTPEQVEKIARLARLALTDEERTRYATELSAILQYVEKLAAVPTENVQPTNQVTEQTNTMRPDAVQPADPETIAAILAQVPERRKGAVAVPAVFSSQE